MRKEIHFTATLKCQQKTLQNSKAANPYPSFKTHTHHTSPAPILDINK
jgi:hypothetical protein